MTASPVHMPSASLEDDVLLVVVVEEEDEVEEDVDDVVHGVGTVAMTVAVLVLVVAVVSVSLLLPFSTGSDNGSDGLRSSLAITINTLSLSECSRSVVELPAAQLVTQCTSTGSLFVESSLLLIMC